MRSRGVSSSSRVRGGRSRLLNGLTSRPRALRAAAGKINARARAAAAATAASPAAVRRPRAFTTRLKSQLFALTRARFTASRRRLAESPDAVLGSSRNCTVLARASLSEGKRCSMRRASDRSSRGRDNGRTRNCHDSRPTPTSQATRRPARARLGSGSIASRRPAAVARNAVVKTSQLTPRMSAVRRMRRRRAARRWRRAFSSGAVEGIAGSPGRGSVAAI